VSRPVWLLTGTPYDPVTDGQVTVRMGSLGWSSLIADTPSAALWRSALMSPYNRRHEVMQGGRLTYGSPPYYGDVTIANAAGEWDYLLAYEWAGSALLLEYLADEGNAYSAATTVFQGVASRNAFGSELELHLPARDRRQLFDHQVQTRTFRGFGPALRFEAGEYVSWSSTPAEVNLTGALTLMAWVRLYTLGGTGNQALQTWAASSGTSYPFDLHLSATGQVVFQHKNSGTTYSVSTTATLAAGTTYHLAVTVTGTAVVVYIWDDDAQSLTTESLTLGSGTRAAAADTFKIGYSAQDGKQDVWEARVYSAALTQADIELYREHRAVGDELIASLDGYWRLDDFSVGGSPPTSVADTSGNGNTGTINGNSWVGSLEGPESLAGTPRPVGWGVVREAPGILIDDARNAAGTLVYYVVDGPINAVSSVKDRGVELTAGADQAEPYVSGLTFSGVDYYPCTAYGCILLNADPAGELTVTCQGNTEGGYSAARHTIMRRIAVHQVGLADPGDIDTAAFTAAAAADVAGDCGWYAGTSPVAASAALDELSAPDGWWTFTRADKLSVRVLPVPEGIVGATALDDGDVLSSPLDPIDLPPPPWQIAVGYYHHERFYAANDLAGAAAELEDLAGLTKEWRFAEDTDLSIYADIIGSEPETFPSRAQTEAGARALAARLRSLIGVVGRRMYRLGRVDALFAHEVGDEVEMGSTVDRYTLAGLRGVIVGLTEDAARGDVQMTVWGS